MRSYVPRQRQAGRHSRKTGNGSNTTLHGQNGEEKKQLHLKHLTHWNLPSNDSKSSHPCHHQAPCPHESNRHRKIEETDHLHTTGVRTPGSHRAGPTRVDIFFITIRPYALRIIERSCRAAGLIRHRNDPPIHDRLDPATNTSNDDAPQQDQEHNDDP